ncbi:MAG: nuclear transport factor 2 family protein [Acidimicrobiia bacterium]|jgi:ketosteroid isomerase-like protein
MTELHPNAQVVLKGFQAFAEGDMATMRELFTEDAVWHVGGHNRWTGDYQGLDAILEYFGGLAGEASFDQDIHAVLADDEHVATLVNTTATRGDKALESQTVFIFHVGGGRVSEVWGTSLDDHATDEFWG